MEMVLFWQIILQNTYACRTNTYKHIEQRTHSTYFSKRCLFYVFIWIADSESDEENVRGKSVHSKHIRHLAHSWILLHCFNLGYFYTVYFLGHFRFTLDVFFVTFTPVPSYVFARKNYTKSHHHHISYCIINIDKFSLSVWSINYSSIFSLNTLTLMQWLIIIVEIGSKN